MYVFWGEPQTRRLAKGYTRSTYQAAEVVQLLFELQTVRFAGQLWCSSAGGLRLTGKNSSFNGGHKLLCQLVRWEQGSVLHRQKATKTHRQPDVTFAGGFS